jgi:hypothetical protein
MFPSHDHVRQYFTLRDQLLPNQSEEQAVVANKLQEQFGMRENQARNMSTK